MSLLLNRAKVVTATTGTGTVNLGSAISPYQTWAAALALTAHTYTYLIEDGTAWEIGEGIYTSGSPDTLSRSLVASSTGSLLSLSGSATVACVAKAQDFGATQRHVFPGGTSTISFTLIGTPDTVELEIIGRTTQAALLDGVQIRLNGLTTNIYDHQRMLAQGATATGPAEILSSNSWGNGSFVAGTTVTDTAVVGASKTTIYGCQSAWYKDMTQEARVPNSASTGNSYVIVSSGQCRTTAAITSVSATLLGGGNFVAGGLAILRERPA